MEFLRLRDWVGLGLVLWLERINRYTTEVVIDFVLLDRGKEMLGLGFLSDRNIAVEREGWESVEFRHVYPNRK